MAKEALGEDKADAILEKHDIKFCKPVEKMVKAPAEVDIQKLLAKAGDGNT